MASRCVDPTSPSCEQNREIGVTMAVAIGDLTGEEDQAVIQEGRLALLHLRHLGHQVRELLNLPGVDDRQLVVVLLKTLVMRDPMVATADPEEVVGSVAPSVAQHEGEYSGAVALERQHHQVGHGLNLTHHIKRALGPLTWVAAQIVRPGLNPLLKVA